MCCLYWRGKKSSESSEQKEVQELLVTVLATINYQTIHPPLRATKYRLLGETAAAVVQLAGAHARAGVCVMEANGEHKQTHAEYRMIAVVALTSSILHSEAPVRAHTSSTRRAFLWHTHKKAKKTNTHSLNTLARQKRNETFLRIQITAGNLHERRCML